MTSPSLTFHHKVSAWEENNHDHLDMVSALGIYGTHSHPGRGHHHETYRGHHRGPHRGPHHGRHDSRGP